MVWHFIFVVLDTFLNKYSYGAELLSYIKSFEKLNLAQRPDIKIDLFWDSEEFLNNSVQVHYDKNKVEYIRKEKNIFHSQMLGDFVKDCDLQENETTCFSIFCHGMGFYYRHDSRVYDINSLFSKIDTKFDVIILESCYLATVEVAYEFQNKCDFMIASESDHNRFGHFTKNLFLDSNSLNIGEFLYKFCNDAINKNIEENISFIYKPIVDFSIIDMQGFKNLWSFIKENPLKLNLIPNDIWKTYRIFGKLADKKCPNYDLFGIASFFYKGENLKKFKDLFRSAVLMTFRTNRIEYKKYKLNGLAWCPVPWDMKNGWCYKYLSIYPEAQTLILLPVDYIY